MLISDARAHFCYWATRDLGYSQIELARRLEMSQPGVGCAVIKGEEISKKNGYRLQKCFSCFFMTVPDFYKEANNVLGWFKSFEKGLSMKKKIGSSIFLLCFLLSFPCFAQDDVIRVKAPEELAELWKQFNGDYVMYVHKAALVKKFTDLDGMVLMVAVIDSKDILVDAKNFLIESGLKRKIHIQNNPKFYDKQFLEMTDSIGMMVKSVAKHYEFDKSAKLERLEFE